MRHWPCSDQALTQTQTTFRGGLGHKWPHSLSEDVPWATSSCGLLQLYWDKNIFTPLSISHTVIYLCQPPIISLPHVDFLFFVWAKSFFTVELCAALWFAQIPMDTQTHWPQWKTNKNKMCLHWVPVGLLSATSQFQSIFIMKKISFAENQEEVCFEYQ